MNIIMSAIVVVGLLFGGSATVSAAQDDLPTEPLYQLKLVSEDAQVWFASDPVVKIEKLMEQAQTRTEEMAALTLAGVTPPAKLTIRMQQHIRQAVQFAAALEEPAMLTALDQIRTHLQTQEQLMAQLQDGSCAECEPILQQTREMLQTHLGQVEDSIEDPGAFRNQNQNQNQIRITQTPPATGSTVTPQASCPPALDGTGQQKENGNPPAATSMPQDNGNQNSNANDNGSGDNSNTNDNMNGSGNGNDNVNDNGNGNGHSSSPGDHGGKP